MTDPLKTGDTIGILGGGQLGRMLSVAASRLGFKTHIYEPGANPPAGDVAHRVTTAAYDDTAALTAFANSVDVITYEFENIPTSALDLLETLRTIRPGRAALATSQDRLIEKTFLQGLGLLTAPFADITDRASLDRALADIGTPAILKTRTLGYDGKGQSRIMSANDADRAFANMAGRPRSSKVLWISPTKYRSSVPVGRMDRSPAMTPAKMCTRTAFWIRQRFLPA